MRNKLISMAFIAVSATGLSGCDDDDPQIAAAADLVAVTQPDLGVQRLVAFNRQTPGTLTQTTDITGLDTGDIIIGMDLRPADNVLVALTRNGTAASLYSIATSGAATFICDLVTGATPTAVALGAMDGYGTDFNPTALAGNALRVVSSAGQNLRVETRPATTLGTNIATAGQCATATDTALNTVTAGMSASRTGISAAAYANSVAGAVTTTLYYLDTDEATPTATVGDRLTISTDPNGGLVGNVGGPLGPDITSINGFEITASSNLATLAGQVGADTSSRLYNVNLVSGLATELGTVGGGEPITGLTTRP